MISERNVSPTLKVPRHVVFRHGFQLNSKLQMLPQIDLVDEDTIYVSYLLKLLSEINRL